MLADLTQTLRTRTLTAEDIAAVANALLDPSVEDALKANFLRTWAQRGETAAELAACAPAFLPKAVDPGVCGSWNGKALLDCCGTGGGGLNMINISTGLMFILAAMGVPVVKHGNCGITKRSGSADVLEAMAIRIDLPPQDVPRCLEEIGCAFLFAPAYHTSFAVIAPVRKALAAEGQRTVFNLIGPLLNPARPDSRLVGVFSQVNLALYRDALTLMQCPRFTVVCGQDAESGTMIGEATSQGANIVGSTLPLTELIRTPDYEPHEHIDSLLVRNADESAMRIEAVLSGEDQELARDTMVLNAALASWTQGNAASLDEGLAQAAEAIDSGAALKKLRAWQTFSEK